MQKWEELKTILKTISDPDLEIDKKQLNRKDIILSIKIIQSILFPNYFQVHHYQNDQLMDKLFTLLLSQVEIALNSKKESVEKVVNQFMLSLSDIKESAISDIQAIYDGDPAAKSKTEVLLAYPGFYATLIYRIAHVFYRLKVFNLARIMSEYAHEKTGIDIHPGAQIGDYFCIDHGTGIVIGETCVIGHHVKIYQGVTLGARSFPVNEKGLPVKNIKRHPNIGNYVIIYANATILGGDTTIADNCIIGGNTWITKSVVEKQIVAIGNKHSKSK